MAGWRECRSHGRKAVACLPSQPKHPTFSPQVSGPLSSPAASKQGCDCLGRKETTVPFPGTLRNQSRFLKCLCPLEEIYDVIVFKDFGPSDVCPKAHAWFLRFLDKPVTLLLAPSLGTAPRYTSPLLSMRCTGCLHPVHRLPPPRVSHLIRSSQLLSF